MQELGKLECCHLLAAVHREEKSLSWLELQEWLMAYFELKDECFLPKC